MSKLKSFLDRRSENLNAPAKKQIKEEASIKETKMDDDEFWLILRQLKKRNAVEEKEAAEILEELLTPYTDEQVEQFSEMYQRLNS